MPARLLDGAALARRMREALQPQVQAFTARAGRPPGLALVLVGDDPASHVYVGSKRSHGTEVGFRVDLHQHPASLSLDDVLALVRSLNADPQIDGILVQSPLPSSMGADAARRVFRLLEWTGFASADFVRGRDGRYYFLEVNPRPWGSIAAAADAGVDLFTPYVALLRGETVVPDLHCRDGVVSTLFPQRMTSRIRPGQLHSLLRALVDPASWRAIPWRRYCPSRNWADSPPAFTSCR